MKTVITLLIFTACLNANAQVCYNPATNFAAGSLPFFITYADLNADGLKDLVVCNFGSDNISVLLGTGSGNFGAPTNFIAGDDPLSAGVNDFNQDGKLDLAVCNWTSNTVSVLLGTGTGTFGSATNYAVGSESSSVVTDDFNKDGKADLAISNRGSNSVSILLGTGTGTFGVANNFTVGLQPRHLSKADINGDGVIDLVTANYGANSISVLLGTGTGSFSPSTDFGAGDSPHSVSCADFNKDGKVDIAVANIYSNDVSVLMGNGTGSFSAAINYVVGSYPESVISTDVNGDGNIDLAIANTSSNNVSVLLGTGTGSFGTITNIAVGVQPSYLISADINNDGKDDLVTENYGSNNVSVLLNCTEICTGGYGPANNSIAGANPRFIINKDLDKDGNVDLIVANQTSNNVSILMGLGAGKFNAPTYFAVGDLPLSTTIEDFNQDGISDLAVANFNSNNVSVLLGTGTGSFGLATNISAGNGTAYVISKDFNKDGIADLAVTNYYSNTVSILLGNGLGSFGTASDITLDSGPYSITSADFNEDGNADLAITNNLSDNVSVLLGTGTGSFGAANNFIVGDSPNSVTCADFNWDGKIDLAIANRNSDNVSVLLGTGSGSFGTVTNFAVGDTPWSLINDDLNRDGNPDLVVTNQNSDNISILLGTGTGNFSVAENISTDSGPISLTNADFNMDGKTDLVVAINESNNVSVLLNLILPNLSAGDDQAVCTGTSVTLSGSGAVTYEWSNGVTDGTPFNPLATTTYTVTGNDGTGCTKTDSVVVTVNSLPIDLDLSITNGLVAFYPFNGNANDESGNGYNATMLNAEVYTTDRYGQNNKSYNNDIGSGFTIPISNTLLGSDFTISFWSNLENNPLYSFFVYYNNDNDNAYKVQLVNDGAINLYLRDVGDIGGYTIMSLPDNNFNQWEHITVVNDNNVWKYYINGIYISEVDKTVSQIVFSKIIWCTHNPINSSFDLKGKIDDIHIFNRVLNEEEIQFLFTGDVPIKTYVAENIICENDSTDIYITNSQNGISYQLIKDGIDFGIPQIGNSSTLQFNTGSLISTSQYSIRATNNTSSCHIVLDTILTITVNPVYAFTLYDTICDGETYSWQGSDYTTANTYVASYSTINGCDSIYTLNLTVSPVYAFTLYDTICEWETYSWQGSDYTTANTYVASYSTINGCDSIYTLNLTVNPVYVFNENYSICDDETYNWHGTGYTTAGNYTANYSSVNGCDSIYTLNLTVNSVDVSVLVNDPIITANAIGATYQWLDCNDMFSLINGATLQTYNATENGNYAVFIIQGACSDTSACIQITNVGLTSFTIETMVIYPNPVSNELNIEMKGNNEIIDFEILNTMGQVVFKGNLVEKTIVQTSNFEPGVYIIKRENGKTFEFKKIVKE